MKTFFKKNLKNDQKNAEDLKLCPVQNDFYNLQIVFVNQPHLKVCRFQNMIIFLSMIAPQAQFQSVGVWDVGPKPCPRGMSVCLSVGGAMLFEDLVRETAA